MTDAKNVASPTIGDPKTRKQKEIEATDRLLASSQRLLDKVNESYLMRDAKIRDYPTFEYSEVKTGPILGVGGFGIVYEVKELALLVEFDDVIDQVIIADNPGGADNDTASALSDGADSDNRKHMSSNKGSRGKAKRRTVSTPPPSDERHYDVKIARDQMSKFVRRNGEARYAVKRLHSDLSDLERARGKLDLALEAKYLSVIWHPNIVKMRGLPTGSPLDDDYFIVMDRLHGTLAERMKSWCDRYSKNKGKLFGIGANRKPLSQLLFERMTIAYDLAAAFWHLHEKKLVYRDIKQENIGFDLHGDVKIFDFGLCKALSDDLKTKDSNGREVYGYNLTARTGSIPYMAPEIVDCKPYDYQCDVFSFAVLLWEMLSLNVAFRGYSRREFLQRVVRRKERPTVNRFWPPCTKALIREAWDHDPRNRPSMKRVASMLHDDLSSMSEDASKHDRTVHSRRGSEFRLR